MSSESSKVKTESRTRTASGSRRQAARSATLRRLSLDTLETRTLMAVLPAPVFDTTGGNAPASNLGTYQTNGAQDVTANGEGNYSSPSIAIDPNNPLKLVSAWTRNDPKLAPGRTEFVEYAVSSDGGKTWVNEGSPAGFAPDPTTSNPQVPFAVSTDASVQFDRNDDFYFLWSEHQGGNAAGVLRLQKFDFSGATPQAVLATPTNVYEWTADQALSPVLAVDASVKTFSDTNSSGTAVSQSDPNAGNVYVAWTTVNVAPANVTQNFQPNRIAIVESSDGGQTFGLEQFLDRGGNFGIQRMATPQLVVSQGSAARAAGTNGPNDPGSPGVAPGQVSAVWDDYGTLSKANPALDEIVAGGLSGTSFSQSVSFSGANNTIGDGIAVPNSSVNIPTVSTFPIDVNVTDPRFVSLSNLTATVALISPNIGDLSIVLQPPTGSGLQPITLLSNQVNAAGTNLGNFTGASGVNLGVQNGQPVGTTFADNAVRSIVDITANGTGRGAAAPFIGTFRPEGGSLNTLYGGAIAGPANSLNSVNGTWTLVITNFRNGNPGSLQTATLNLTSGLAVLPNTVVATTPVRARDSGASTSVAADTQGIAPAPVIASDNTLGAYSPYQGRLYVAYVGRSTATGTPSDATSIRMAVSDDGGRTWTDPSFGTTSSSQFGLLNFGEIINHDNATTDGFSENTSQNFGLTGRPHFQPNIAVDPTNGTLVASWLDARNDASRSRVATYLTTSIDGGGSFSTDSYANDSQVATDAITGNVVNLGPIPTNENAPSATGVESAVGYGSHQGLAVYGGQAHPVWSDDQNGGVDNKQTLFIWTNTAYYAAGPRVISATQGPVGLPGDTVNSDRAADGTPLASAFIVTFDRPIDHSSFTQSDALVTYRDTTPGNLTGGPVPVTSVVALNTNALGATQFQVNFAPRSGVGTYSLQITSADIHDRIRAIQTITSPVGPSQTLTASVNAPGSVPVQVPNSNTPTVATIPATALPGNEVISNVTVTVNLTTTQDFFIALTLIAPDGTRIPLVNQRSVTGSGGFQNTTFSSSDLNAITFQQGSPPYNSSVQGNFVPAASLTKLNGLSIPAANTGWQLEVRNNRFAGGTTTLNDFSVTYQPAIATQATTPGNGLDQNVKGLSPVYGIPNWPGAAADFFATPMPIAGTTTVLDQTGVNVTPLYIPGTNPGVGPYDLNTLPLIVPGPHVLTTSIPGQPAAPGNLVVNTTVSSIDVTFDRDIDPSTVVPLSVVQLLGPLGKINGPFTITPNPTGSDPNPAFPRTYRVSFPAQTLSGSYSLTLASNITDSHGNPLDTNLNAGIDLLRGTTGGTTTTLKYVAPATYKATPNTPAVANVPLPISDGKTTVSNLTVPDNYLASQVSVQLDITHPNDPDLQITLVSPNNVSIVLVARGTGSTGTHANFSGTIFADQSLAPGSTPTNPIYVLNTPIKNGGPPFFGSYAPNQPLSQLNNVQVNGTWKLIVDDSSAGGKGTGPSGTLNSWSLSFQKSVPSSDLGEQVADQANVSFRIFTMDPTNRQSGTTWTGVGPAPVVNTGSAATTSNGFAGQVSSVAVDPSDPSGNTVFATGGSGGVWKTSNFLTTDPQGPTWTPLTDFGPTSGMNIGSIAVFARNNDQRQSIIIAGTGNGTTSDTGGHAGGNTSPGVGFIISKDGGATWQLLDSTNNNQPYAARDHIFSQASASFAGTSTMKVVVDPHPTPTGGVIIYAALKGVAGGLWQSVDTGQTWTKLSTTQGDATDVVLDYNSATINAVSNPTGNVNVIYAAFPTAGVYISANRGATLTLMGGGNNDPLIVDETNGNIRQVPVNGGANAPLSGFGGRIVLAKPNPLPPTATNADVANILYEGWLYAAVATPDGHLNGVYLTKDNGLTWTKLQITSVPNASANSYPIRAVPSNDNNQSQYDVAANGLFTHADYNLSLAMDPTNPNVVYLGGTANGNQSGFIRVDATTVFDSHALSPTSNNRNDGGQSRYNSTGAVSEVNPVLGFSYYAGTNSNFGVAGPYLNLLGDPTSPFSNDATLYTYNVNAFTNDGSGVKWTPMDALLYANSTSLVPSSNIHNIITYVDPLTGFSRLIVADDQGVFTGVVSPTGTIETSVGNAVLPTYSRNGNLQIAQLTYGAAQPSVTLNAAAAAQNGPTPTGLFYGNGFNLGQVESLPTVLSTGNTTYQGSTDGADQGFFSRTSADQNGVGVAVDQQGGNIAYRYLDPAYGGNGTNFFQVSIDGGITWVSRTTGLVQTALDPQWPRESPLYPNGTVNTTTGNQNLSNQAITFGNLTINPLNSDQVVISSNSGRIFSTINQGKFWLSIGEPGQLDGTYAPALAYGAPDPAAPGGIGNLNNFLYAGTVSGNIFVSQTGGGGNAGAWTNVSTGLDGSPVVKIITDPTRGSHDAYAVTQKGVYYIGDSVVSASNPAPVWTNITNNLFALTTTPFGQISAAQPQLNYLTSLQADWRYVIPNAVVKGSTPSGPSTHPILYVGGEGGVFRSLDNGATWTQFPNQAIDGAPVDGGYLPNVHVSDLTTSLGKIDPSTGRPVAQAGDPNVLLATTFGRGQFAIRLAPLVLPSTVALDTALPAPNGSNNGKDASGNPLVKTSQPVIDGFSEQTAFGNKVRITILDLTNPANPVIIGGYNPAVSSTDTAANYTDSTGHFQVAVNPNGFTSNGLKTIGIQATDASGTQGNIATLTFTLNAKLTSLNAPATPTLTLSPASDSSGGQNVTNVKNPTVIGVTDPGVGVTVTIVSINGTTVNQALPGVTSDTNGNFSVTLPNESDGVYVLKAVATNPLNGQFSTSPLLTFTIKSTVPTTVPTFTLSPADDTGIVGDNITSARLPHFIGKTDPGAYVSVYASKNGVLIPPVLATTRADANGNYSVQLPTALNDGTITLQVQVTDNAGNVNPNPSKPLVLTVVTVLGDYLGTGKTTPALFRRNANGNASWIIQGATSALGVPFGASASDIPLVGDFDGDGYTDKALYRPSAGAFFVARSRAGGETVSLAAYNAPGSVPVVGDFDGDGVSDLGLYNPANGQWTISESTNGLQQITFNTNVFSPLPGDVAVPGDYNSTGRSELAIYRPSTGQFFIKTPGTQSNGQDNITVVNLSTGQPGDVPVPGNYDDSLTQHRTEPAVFNPSTGVWLIQGDQPIQFNPGDIPAPGDYDNLGRTETAVYRPKINAFAVNGPSGIVPLGAAGDIPVTSPLVYRNVFTSQPTLALTSSPLTGSNITSSRHPIFGGTTDPNAIIDLLDANGNVINSAQADSNGRFAVGDPTARANGTYTYSVRAHTAVSASGPVSQPVTVTVTTVQADYTGAGFTQPALFRRPTSKGLTFYVQSYQPLNGRSFSTGNGDVPLTGDFLGTGQNQLVIYTPSTGNWTLEQASTGYAPQTILTNFGSSNVYIPAPGDFTGSGKLTPAVYETTTGKWFISTQASATPPITTYKAGDIPVPGNYDNTGKDELALYRPSNQTWYINGPFGAYPIAFGGVGDIPVPGVYNASATSHATYPAVWRPSSGKFFIRTPSGGTQVDTFKVGDIPAPGDYDGIGMTEAAVFRPSTGQFLVQGPNDATPRVVTTQAFGGPGFVPLTSPYVYRAVPVTPAKASVVKAATSVNLGATALAFSNPAPVAARSLTPAPAPSPVSVATTRTRPLQAMSAKVTPATNLRLLQAHVAVKKGV